MIKRISEVPIVENTDDMPLNFSETRINRAFVQFDERDLDISLKATFIA